MIIKLNENNNCIIHFIQVIDAMLVSRLINRSRDLIFLNLLINEFGRINEHEMKRNNCSILKNNNQLIMFYGVFIINNEMKVINNEQWIDFKANM